MNGRKQWGFGGAVLAGALSVVFGVACGGDTPAAGADVAATDARDIEMDVEVEGDAVDDDTVLPSPPGTTALPADAQRDGDPARGFEILAKGAYVGCGVPASLFPVAQQAGLFGDAPPLPGRDDSLPYFLSRFDTPSGVEVIGPNCFTCHAGYVNGELVLGAPGTNLDFGGLASQIAGFQSQVEQLRGLLNEADFTEIERFAERMSAVAPYVQPEVAGVNPADNLAAILFAHRDPKTLAWSKEPLLAPPPAIVVPVDVPPWWRMKDKHTMFYTAGGRADHARIMMTASTLCVDTVEDAAAIDAEFHHVRSYIEAVPPPAYPFDIDAVAAAEGRVVYDANCAHCHGGPDSYPNLWVELDVIDTDPALAVGGSQFADRFIEWFNASFYGETAVFAPVNGYVAPPLSAIWASAPYLHNGSVPTVATLLDSSTRPTYWRRTFDSTDLDLEGLGFNFETLDVGHADVPSASARRTIYDTTLPGYGNGGHTFGDHLTPTERRALIEYLKTL